MFTSSPFEDMFSYVFGDRRCRSAYVMFVIIF